MCQIRGAADSDERIPDPGASCRQSLCCFLPAPQPPVCHSLPYFPWKDLGDQNSTGLAFPSLNPVLNTHDKMYISLLILTD